MDLIISEALTPLESNELVNAFFCSPNQNLEKEAEFYFNSKGVYNLARTLDYVPRIEAFVKKKYGPNLEFANTYTRLYQHASFLGIHTDRPGLDITVSVCLKKDTLAAWPLHVSNKPWVGSWENNWDMQPWMVDFKSYDLEVGQAVMCEGIVFPHWRDPINCPNGEQNIYAFFHWTRIE